MIQRIQTIYLLLATILCIGCLSTPIAHLLTIEGTETVDMYNLWLVSAEKEHMFYFCPVLMALLVIATAVTFFDIWLYKRRTLQMRLATFSIILVALILLCLAYRGIRHDEKLVRSLDRLR